MNNLIKKCDWDSDFFGIMIGKALVKNDDDIDTLISTGGSEPYNLIYIFADKQIDLFPGCYFVDEKVVFSKRICQCKDCIDAHIRLYVGDAPDDALFSLALQSGEHSRFRTDTHFPEGSYEKLYKKWIENCFTGEMGQYVIGYYDEDTITGFLTINIVGEEASIGLLAVDACQRHQGIGSKLLIFATDFLFREGVQFVSVATQATNEKACLLYEKNGFSIISSTKIYHWWK